MSTSALRAELERLDNDQSPFHTFPEELEAECRRDYLLAYIASPEEQLPPYSEWRWGWLDDRIYAEWDRQEIAAEQERDAEEVLRRMPAPVPYGDEETPF